MLSYLDKEIFQKESTEKILSEFIDKDVIDLDKLNIEKANTDSPIFDLSECLVTNKSAANNFSGEKTALTASDAIQQYQKSNTATPVFGTVAAPTPPTSTVPGSGAVAGLAGPLGGAMFDTDVAVDVGAMPGDFLSRKRKLDIFNNDETTYKATIETAVSQLTESMKERIEKSKQQSDHLTRVVQHAMLGLAFTKRALQRLLDKDIVFPFNVLYFRPNMTYNMANAICLKSGAQTGETLVGHSDFQIGDDVQRKVHYGHYTIRYKSVVYNERAVYHAHNYMCNGYISGNDCKFSNTEHSEGSIYAILAPYQVDPYPNPMDITGQFRDEEEATLHYATADFYSKKHKWNNAHATSGTEPVYSTMQQSNTVVYQGHQAMYSKVTGGFTKVIENTGHWGRNVYPGCGKVRAGLSMALEQVVFKESYGGATQANHTKMG